MDALDKAIELRDKVQDYANAFDSGYQEDDVRQSSSRELVSIIVNEIIETTKEAEGGYWHTELECSNNL